MRNIDDAKLTETALLEHKNEYTCYYKVFIVLAVIALAISIGINAYFVYYKYMNRNKENVSVYDYVYHAKKYKSYKMGTVKQIDIRNRTYYFYNDMINMKNFDSIL